MSIGDRKSTNRGLSFSSDLARVCNLVRTQIRRKSYVAKNQTKMPVGNTFWTPLYPTIISISGRDCSYTYPQISLITQLFTSVQVSEFSPAPQYSYLSDQRLMSESFRFSLGVILDFLDLPFCWTTRLHLGTKHGKSKSSSILSTSAFFERKHHARRYFLKRELRR